MRNSGGYSFMYVVNWSMEYGYSEARGDLDRAS